MFADLEVSINLLWVVWCVGRTLLAVVFIGTMPLS